ncbi:MAG: hypothetical protein JXR94_00995 [Candidatus Hydrogenedentes bacterium]|nr:hypothetical protein [Candidatus Hydrogenedentota bacterium]
MVGIDKLLHFWLSFALGLASPFMAAAAGIGKEIYDALSGGMASAADLLADGLGIVLALIVSPIW